MADDTEQKQNPWLHGQDAPPPGVPEPVPGPGPWTGGTPGAAAVQVRPEVLERSAGASRRLQGDLRYAVQRAEPDTAAAAGALSGGWNSGAALAQLLERWKPRWTSMERRLGLTADRLEATASAYRASEHSAAADFRAR